VRSPFAEQTGIVDKRFRETAGGVDLQECESTKADAARLGSVNRRRRRYFRAYFRSAMPPVSDP